MTDLPYVWRQKKSYFQLIGYKCKKCERINYPKLKKCIECGSEDLEEVKLARTGRLLTYIVNYYMPEEFDKPLGQGVVELDGGGRLMTQFTEIESEKDLEIGMPVEIVIRRMSTKDGLNYYGPKIRPLKE
ncbi:MAG: Zn-ribbon domain-containing OB-fold protein [Candidatus Helarchaeota archaeon]